MDAITNRTKDDVDEVNKLLSIPYNQRTYTQNRRLRENLKGSLNRSDLERIENNIQLLSDVLELNLTTYYGKVPEYPSQTYFNQMIKNVGAIRGAYTIHSTTPKTPSNPINSYTKLNAIEQILNDVYEILTDNFNYFCSDKPEIYLGDSTGLLL